SKCGILMSLMELAMNAGCTLKEGESVRPGIILGAENNSNTLMHRRQSLEKPEINMDYCIDEKGAFKESRPSCGYTVQERATNVDFLNKKLHFIVWLLINEFVIEN
ncbi:hypothetical protein Bhyg_10124, partial [Pseudolycoriella hygida]